MSRNISKNTNNFPSPQMRTKYHLIDGIVLCGCGEPAMVGDKCHRCNSIENVGLERTEFLAQFEIKYERVKNEVHGRI